MENAEKYGLYRGKLGVDTAASEPREGSEKFKNGWSKGPRWLYPGIAFHSRHEGFKSEMVGSLRNLTFSRVILGLSCLAEPEQ